MAYSAGGLPAMATSPSRTQWIASSDSAYLITCAMSAASRPQLRLEPYHIRQRPPSRMTQGYETLNGSTGPRSTTGAGEILRNGAPGASLTASPMLLRQGTVTPRFQPR